MRRLELIDKVRGIYAMAPAWVVWTEAAASVVAHAKKIAPDHGKIIRHYPLGVPLVLDFSWAEGKEPVP